MTSSGRVDVLPRLFDIGVDIFGDAGDERMFEPLLDRQFAPGEVFLLRLHALALVAFGERQQALGRVRAAVEHDIFAGLAQLRIDISS